MRVAVSILLFSMKLPPIGPASKTTRYSINVIYGAYFNSPDHSIFFDNPQEDYLFKIRPIFFTSIEIVPSGLLINSMKS